MAKAPIIRSGAEAFLEVHRANPKRPADCPIVKAMDRAKRAGTPWAEVRASLVAHEGWHPRFSVDGVLKAAAYAEPDCTETQVFYARTLADPRFAESERRGAIQRLLRDHGADVCPEAWAVLVEALAGVHQNAKAFVAKAEILEHAPHDLDLTGLPCLPQKARDARGELVNLSDLPLRGKRGAKPETPEQEVVRLRAELEAERARPKAPVSLAKAIAAMPRDKAKA